ncbi:MAG: DUF1707 domain-containing protein [Nocardioides sp.]|uniref:DUF1707 SHOCT-like domain-containing protein n=1 Tax=Nocardioides sp. TaxID=35761 RepID=UPI003F122690
MSPSRSPRGPRARDTDREAVARLLSAAYGEGQIDLDEHERRSGEVWQARTVGQLEGLVGDLQPTPGVEWVRPRQPSTGRPTTDARTPTLVGSGQVPERRVLMAVAAVGLVLAGVVVWRVLGVGVGHHEQEAVAVPEPQPYSSATAEPEAFEEDGIILDPRTPEGYEAFVAALEEEFDDTFVIRATLHDTAVYVTRMTNQKKLRWTTWYWDGDWSEWSVGTYDETDDVWSVRAKGVDPTTFDRAVEKVTSHIDEPEDASIWIAHDPRFKRSCYEVFVRNKWDDTADGYFGCGGLLLHLG